MWIPRSRTISTGVECPLLTGEKSGKGGYAPSPEKNCVFVSKWHVLGHSDTFSKIIVPVTARSKAAFFCDHKDNILHAKDELRRGLMTCTKDAEHYYTSDGYKTSVF